jgi:hypothetical protein
MWNRLGNLISKGIILHAVARLINWLMWNRIGNLISQGVKLQVMVKLASCTSINTN